MELKKFETKGLEGATLTFAETANGLIDQMGGLMSELEAKGAEKTEIETRYNELNGKLADIEKKGASAEKELQSLENDLLKRINALGNKPAAVEYKSVSDQIVAELKAYEVKDEKDMKRHFKGEGIELEVKDAIILSDYTGNATRTKEVSGPKFAPITPNAFFGVAGPTTGVVEGGKSLLMWIPGAYTSNVGYAAEVTAHGTDDAASATEKIRAMAKIAAKLPMSAEMFEDLPQFAQRLTDQLQRKAAAYVDAQIWGGDGNDAGSNGHIVGVNTALGSTPFVSADYAGMYKKADMSDLVDACATQIELAGYKANTLRLNPKDASKLRRQKDANGQPIVQQLVDGTPTIGGLRLITSSTITAGTMLVSQDDLIQIWTKRNLELKVGQFSDDAIKDQYTALLFARVQCLVDDIDRTGVVYVSDIATAIGVISQA